MCALQEIKYVYPISRNDSEEKVNTLKMISIRDTKMRSISTLLLIKHSISLTMVVVNIFFMSTYYGHDLEIEG